MEEAGSACFLETGNELLTLFLAAFPLLPDLNTHPRAPRPADCSPHTGGAPIKQLLFVRNIYEPPFTWRACLPSQVMYAGGRKEHFLWSLADASVDCGPPGKLPRGGAVRADPRVEDRARGATGSCRPRLSYAFGHSHPRTFQKWDLKFRVQSFIFLCLPRWPPFIHSFILQP